MTGLDRITTDHWTVAFPADWIDRSDDGKLYFEAPDGAKGFYIEFWVMSQEEHLGPEELISSFQKAELKTFFPEGEGWEVSSKLDANGLPAVGRWSGFSAKRSYRISGKQVADGKFVLRGTFHDYHCTDVHQSFEFFAPIIDSLQLHET